MKPFLRKSYLLALLLTILTGLAVAQRYGGGLRGTVTDPQGAIVPGAKVTITNEATNVSQSNITTSAGTYTFPSLIPGNYTVVVEAKSFSTTTRKAVSVFSDQENEANIQLGLGKTSEVVEVTAGAD